MSASRITAISLVLVGILVCFTACNSVGPYYGSVYRLDDSTYSVNLSTWIGSGHGWPKGSEELKRNAEDEARASMHRAGIEVDTCDFHRFVPYEGGHIVVCLFAGKKETVKRWTEMPDQEFDQWLRDHPVNDAIAKFDGRLPQSVK